MSQEFSEAPSVDAGEARHFARLAADWWSDKGRLASLHAFNPARLKFIVGEVLAWRGEAAGSPYRPLAGLKVLDVGCGGGILCEPLARLGGEVTGIDPVGEAIEVAKSHALAQSLAIAYRNASAEALAKEGVAFDLLVASEVIEHVADVPGFLRTLRALLRRDGLLIVSTLNRTAKSYALAILAAERLLGIVPRGTHAWRKFLKPEELRAHLSSAGFTVEATTGIVLDAGAGLWKLAPADLGVNYIVSATAN